jgi:DNA-directed RNA polymerase specialized sigma24 family protein
MQQMTTELQQQIEWRKNQVLELSSQGYTEREIASRLQVHCTTVHRDLVFLNKQARENLQKHIHETIPAEYQKAMNSLNQVLRMTWSIVSKTEDEKIRLQALALINDVNKYRTELVTNGVIVHDFLQIIQSKMEHLNGKNEDKKLLHDINEREDAEAAEAAEAEEETTTNGVF